MQLKIKLIRAFILRLGLLFVFLLSMLAFLIATTPGVKLSLRIANLLLPGTLSTQALTGHFFKNLSIDALTYTHQKQTIILKSIQLKWYLVSRRPLNIHLNINIQALQLNQDKTNLTLDTLQLSGDFNQLTGAFKLGNNQITLKGPLKGPWAIHADLVDLKQLNPALENLSSHLTADATVYDMQHAILNARLTPGRYHLPKDSSPQYIAFKGASLKAVLDPTQLKLNAYCQIDENISARLQLELPDVKLNQPPPPTQPVLGQAQLTVNSLQFLEDINQFGELSLMFQAPRGKINATLDISGALNQPKLTGHIMLTEGHVTLPNLGLILNPITLSLKTDGTQWRGQSIIKPNNGEALTLDGQGTVTPAFTGTATLQGNQVLVMNTPEYQIKASPNLIFIAKPDAYHIDGSILIPSARITPLSFIHTERLTHDAIFSKEETNQNPLNLISNIMIDMGKDVRVDVKGIQGAIDGMLHIKQLPKQALTAEGTLKLRDGHYEAYGQKLDIEQGELIFMGQQIDNPNLRVRAIRHFKQTNAQFSGSNQLFDFSAENLDTPNLGENTTVGITASGRVDSPNVKLFSSPPNLSQADILSMLLLGKPADQASKSGGQILIQAMTAMHLTSGSKGIKMIQDLQKSIGIDVDVQNKSLGTASSDFTKTSVSVGKSITKRIYLQYNVGLFQENSSVFTLTYLLNKFLSVKVTASDIGNGIDFMYSHSD